MTWLTHEWATGGLSHEEYEERWRLHLAHRVEVLPRLSGGAERLVDGIDLHDGMVRSFEYLPRDMLTCRVLIGDMQVGYEFVELGYVDAELRLEPGSTIETLSLFDAETEIISDEVDVAAAGRFVHRVLLWPRGEYEVEFTSLTENREAATSADRFSRGLAGH